VGQKPAEAEFNFTAVFLPAEKQGTEAVAGYG